MSTSRQGWITWVLQNWLGERCSFYASQGLLLHGKQGTVVGNLLTEQHTSDPCLVFSTMVVQSQCGKAGTAADGVKQADLRSCHLLSHAGGMAAALDRPLLSFLQF